ncbi:DUF1648 domain-containing protein [Bacillus chungangensis]|uniref:Membrane protein n=1 Tax=Bacillus chungangensis TaxID=587633 RepID=A0ABT9WQ62_9BACI|nr:DUF5808 domain-containing protein [Bacillus chungangensis]MDQ0175431.1 putative membrane protein [Bacillus chungangensis]
MTLMIFLTIILFLAAIEISIPFLVKRDVVFGVSIPEGHIKDAKLASYKRRYSLSIFFISVASIAFYLLWINHDNPVEELIVLYGTAIQLGIIFLSMALYFYFHAKTMKRKKEQKWGENFKKVKMADLAIRSQDEMLPWYLFVLPMAVTVGLIAYTAVQYRILPEQIPFHWGADGMPDSFKAKNPFSVNVLPIILFIMQLLFLGINEATKRSGIKLSVANTEASRIRQLALRKYSSWFMFMTSTLITMLFSFLQLTTIHEGLVGSVVMFAVPFIFLLIILIGTAVFAIKVGTAGEHTETHPVEGISDFDDDLYWRAGIFYFNKNDPSIFVEKRFGVGWTINLANPIGYLIIFGPLVIIFLIAFLA